MHTMLLPSNLLWYLKCLGTVVARPKAVSEEDVPFKVDIVALINKCLDRLRPALPETIRQHTHFML